MCGWRVLGAALLLLAAVCPVTTVLRDFRIVSKNVTSMLDALLDKTRYDKRIRPHFGGPPVKITANLVMKSMDSVSDTDESYTMDIYFRQTWQDPRLAFSLPGRDVLSFSWFIIGFVWKPDTYFMNGKKSHLHRITVPNTFFRISKDGSVTYSMRLTVTASCRMHLRKFPLDSQKCPLLISSYGYKSADVMYNWSSTQSEANVVIEPTLEIAQYDLESVQTTDHRTVYRGESGQDEYSTLKVVFHLKRHTGFFMLQVYVPCGLIVCCSWVSFWIDPDAVPARVALGVTTALSLTTMGFGGKAQMPKVSYPTALDWFVILCFSFVFAAMVEYAIINFLDKITKDIKRLLQQRKKKDSPPEGGTEDAAAVSLEVPTERQRSASMVELPASSVSAPFLSPARVAAARRRASQVLAPVVSALRRLSSAVSLRPEHQEEGEGEEVRPGTWNIPSIRVTRRHSAERGPGDVIYGGSETSAEHVYAELDELARRSTLEVDDEEYDYRLGVDGAEEDTVSRVVEALVSTRTSLRRFVSSRLEAWRRLRLLPREEDILAALSSGETPDKFSAIDIQSRKVFPLCFVALLAIYWIAYTFYITDELSVRESKTLRYKKS